MKRLLITAAAVGLVVAPAALGLWANSSFSQAVPVTVPASVTPTSASSDDDGGVARDQRFEPGDDRAVQATAPATVPTPAPTGVDDHGGETPRDERFEPGDDRAVQGATPAPAPAPTADDQGGDLPRDGRVEPGDDHGGSDDGTDDATSGHGGHGGDD